MEKNYRLHTTVGSDSVLNVNMRQDFEFLEVLSLRLKQEDTYKLHSSNYGVIVGRVLANDAFGIPNAKVSIFIERDDSDSTDMSRIYPYEEVTSLDYDRRRYNLLPDYSDDTCYKVVGTFPNKRYLLNDDTMLEVYDKYWKYTTVTNQAGDYMIFGVPTGYQTLHADIDLSDIGILSQKPRDFEYKGYSLTMFDSSVQFKDSTNLDGLAQLYSQNKGINVYPFWGDEDTSTAAITRCDISIQYKFEPTCVFMGAIVSDNDSNSIGHKCEPKIGNGMNNQLIGGEGTIEMIRKTPDELVEEFQINGNQLIDENGVWCYQIPMNLDYIGTDEYGNVIPTDNPSKGIPTRARVRFRISKNETGDEGFSRHTAKYLVPMNPILDEDEEVPTLKISGAEAEKMYNFGSGTPDSCFRDLYWNNVYSVKNYIPRSQISKRANSKNYTALKGANLVDDQNSIPFNKLRIDLPFSFTLSCLLFSAIVIILVPINALFCVINDIVLAAYNRLRGLCLKLPFGIKLCPFGFLPKLGYIGCIGLPGGFGAENVTFFPGCYCSKGKKYGDCQGESDTKNCEKRESIGDLKDTVQRSLALDYKIVKMDFYQDWLNGTLYMPLWYWRKRRKKSFLFGLITSKAKSQYCSCDTVYKQKPKTVVPCNIEYSNNSMNTNNNLMPDKEKRWHKKRNGNVWYKRGLIKPFENKDGLTLYYYVAMQPTLSNQNPSLALGDIGNSAKIMVLYATDIILLGNLDPNNIYGIPQFYNCLPSTTVNVPPIASVKESSDEEDEEEESDTDKNEEDNGDAVVTGMDWGRKGNKETPMYKSGLFMDIACAKISTKPKSCINIERLSELGVNLDMSYDTEYRSSSSINTGRIEGDGFVSKYELDDTDNRAMFATLNHIGFIPQSYQESINSYETQIKSKNTNYFLNKFKYIYPTDFDGRLSTPMSLYKKGFAQAEEDRTDEEYLTFRFGAENGKRKEYNSEGRIRHFYNVDSSRTKFSMPLYNNSFYFFFGIKKGNTAIDKFNKMFNSSCFSQYVYPFTLDVESRGLSYCPSMYGTEGIDGYDGISYIKVNVDDITLPYTYTLTDSNGNETVPKTEIKDSTNFTISGISNQDYTLEVTDGNGKTITKRISLSIPKIKIDYTSYNLGTKFYSEEESPNDFICDKNAELYGLISITGITIDGYEFHMTEMTDAQLKSEHYYFRFNVAYNSNPSITSTITFKVYALDDSVNIDKCLCKHPPTNSSIVDAYEFKGDKFNLYVYRPNRIQIITTQICNSSETTNSSSDIITILNGSNFMSYLNDMPVKFMIGSTTDEPKDTNFYKKVVDNVDVKYYKGWCGIHNEENYIMPEINNESAWEDFVTLQDGIESIESKKEILLYKFNKMFSLADAAYVTNNSYCRFRYTSEGGTPPILTRSLYANTDNVEIYTLYDDTESECNNIMPNIVGSNYSGVSEDISFNPFYNNQRQGSYFAAFTNDGGYTSRTGIDESISVMKIPVNTLVSPIEGGSVIKPKGKDVSGKFDKFSSVCGSGSYNSYFRGLFSDRRFDYNLTIIAPYLGSILSLHKDGYADEFWKNIRLSGITYGGIEMGYNDEDYNIIGPNAEYSYDLQSAKTKLNDGVLRRFYESSINNIDVKDYYWSTFNENIPSSGNSGLTIINHNGDGQYNGEFGIDNFTTKRVIDVTNIPKSKTLLYNVTSCGYDIEASLDLDNNITCEAVDGESTDIEITFKKPITIITTDDKDFANLSYSRKGNDFVANNTCTIKFRYNALNDVNYNIYTKTPKAVKVLPIQSDGSGNSQSDLITSLKITRFESEKDIDNLINNNLICNFNKTSVSRWEMIHLKKYPSVIAPSGIGIGSGYKSKYDKISVEGDFFKVTENGSNEFLPSDDDRFPLIIFDSTFELDNTKVFTILVDREYQSTEDDYLTRRIRTIEFGDLYDCRNVKVELVNGVKLGGGTSRDTSGKTVEETVLYSYTEKLESGLSKSRLSKSGLSESGVSESGVSQVLSVRFVMSDDTYSSAFKDTTNMKYTFKFTDKDKKSYYIESTDAKYDNNNKSTIVTVEWDLEMGSLFDDNWNNGNCTCTIYAKTVTNFIYSIGEIKINASGSIPTTVGHREPIKLEFLENKKS